MDEAVALPTDPRAGAGPLTSRDHIAIEAMGALIRIKPDNRFPDNIDPMIIKLSYLYADAMLTARDIPTATPEA